jgi:hypothetical protein
MPTSSLALWVVFAACITAVCVLTFFTVLYRLHKIGVTMSDVQAAVDAVTAQVAKGTAEVVAQVAALEAQVAAGEAPDLTALKAAAQALDDLNVDAPVDEPADEPVAEPSE